MILKLYEFLEVVPKIMKLFVTKAGHFNRNGQLKPIIGQKDINSEFKQNFIRTKIKSSILGLSLFHFMIHYFSVNDLKNKY